METYKIIIREDAKKDISELYDYIAENDLVGKAKIFVKELMTKIRSLSTLPQRGFRLREIEKAECLNLQEIYYKSYRIIYEIWGDTVRIRRILDGRRNLKKIFLKHFVQL